MSNTIGSFLVTLVEVATVLLAALGGGLVLLLLLIGASAWFGRHRSDRKAAVYSTASGWAVRYYDPMHRITEVVEFAGRDTADRYAADVDHLGPGEARRRYAHRLGNAD